MRNHTQQNLELSPPPATAASKIMTFLRNFTINLHLPGILGGVGSHHNLKHIYTPSNQHTVDGRNPANQLRETVAYPSIYRVLLPSQVVQCRISEPSTVAPENWWLEFGAGHRCSVCFWVVYLYGLGFFEFSQDPTSLSYKVGPYQPVLSVGVEIAPLIVIGFEITPVTYFWIF